MDFLQAIVLGIVQGLTEFLPISSSGHLILVPWLFGWDEPGLSFDAALHLGTLVAVFGYFWRDIVNMVKALPIAIRRPGYILRTTAEELDPKDRDARLVWLLIIGSIPGGIAGLLLQSSIDDFFHGEEHKDLAIALIAVMLMLFALLLLAADRAAKHRREIRSLGAMDAAVVGLAQMLALFPGVSRSGVTLTAGLFREMKRADAARFSFLLGMPLVTIAALKGFYDLVSEGSAGVTNAHLIAGVLASAISGFAAISVLLRFLQRSNTNVFVIYRVIAGLTVLALLATSVR